MADNSEVVQAVAAIYARSAAQPREGDRSLDIQVESCLDKARAAGFAVPPELIFQEVWSGIDLERPALTQLRNLARSAKLQVLYVVSADRLFRGFGGLFEIIEEFEGYGVRVEFVHGERVDLDNLRSIVSAERHVS